MKIKNKFMLSTLGILILSLVIITSLYITIVNYQHKENIKKNLQNNNKIVIKLINSGAINNLNQYFKSFRESNIRVTLIDKNGIVLQDSDAIPDKMNNHNLRQEILGARENERGYSIRYSESLRKKMMYYATRFNDGHVIRSSMPMEVIMGFEWKYLKYYLITLIIVFCISFIFSSKLVYLIIKPIKNLEFITSRIAKGELHKRVNIESQDEIGQLANTFNHMAERLQYTIKDSIDKQNKLEAILNSMDSGVIAVDKDYKIIMVNPYAKKIFKIEKDIIGGNLINSIRDYELEEVFKNSEGSKEITVMWPKKRDLKVKTADILSEGEHIGTVAVIQDITDIKKLEKIKSEFVANVSHELKTPLTSIKGFAETLRYVEDKETSIKFLSIIDEETERLTRLINDILTLSDIEQHRDSKVKEDIDVMKALKNIYGLMKNFADKKNIDLKISGYEHPIIYGDKDKFKQMLINLIDNAIKYSEEEDCVSVIVKTIENICVISVKDTGTGIPKEHLPRLFERFYRVDKARARVKAKGGTGLGLAIVKHIVLSFNGKIFVESQIKKGTKFTIKIPLK